MRLGWRAFLVSALVATFLFSSALLMADEYTQILTSRSIASFDNPAQWSWIVQGSKFATEGYPQSEIVKAWPDALYGRNLDNKALYSLGIHGKFDRKAYNYIEIIPATKDASGQLQPSSLPIPGRAQSLDVWVWGSNYNYWLDIYLRDYQGVDHVLHLGSIQFAGWKNLKVEIPTAIPQARKYIPRYEGTEVTKLVLWTAPEEKVDDFYVFIDEISCLTDVFESRFDGEDLADPTYLNNIWQQGNK
jgi:hypothetical protein